MIRLLLITIGLVILCSTAHAAERTGFVIPEVDDSVVAEEADDVQPAWIPQPQPVRQIRPPAEPARAAVLPEVKPFVETTADSEYVATLTRTVADRDRRIAVLEKKVDDLTKENEQLRVRTEVLLYGGKKKYEVKKKDTLWKIAKRKDVYGDPYLWIKLYNANIDKIKDPAKIYPGQLLDIP